MGLVSLPVLNKVSNSNYWNNLWDSSLLFKKYFYLSLFINKFFNLIFLDYSLKIINKIVLKKQLNKGYYIDNSLNKKLIKNFIIGKIWILKYQKWYIINLRLFTLKSINKKQKNYKLKYKENFFFYKYLKENVNYKKNNFLNYKYKF